VFEIGPYRFSDVDVAATLRHADDLFDVLVDGVDPVAAALAAPYRERALAAAARSGAEGLAGYWPELRACAAALRAAGAYGEPLTGRVAQLNTSGGGVPKLPVERVTVGYGGVVGDVQATRKHHGRPWQGLCLWGAEVIDAFAADGHPICYGSAGENVTVAGIDWARVRPGVMIDLGTVTAEAMAYAIPCHQNARWFRDGQIHLMHRSQGPVARVYAMVVTPGEIAVGDPITVRS